MNRQKGLSPILIIILIAVTVGGFLIYQKQSKDGKLGSFDKDFNQILSTFKFTN